jgi:hypothetical protein
MDELNRWRAMTTIVLFGTFDMPISSTTLADTFRIIGADEFIQRLLYATRESVWSGDLYSIKADAIFTIEGVPQRQPIRLSRTQQSPYIQTHHDWYQEFLKELMGLWSQTPSVIVVRLIVSLRVDKFRACSDVI